MVQKKHKKRRHNKLSDQAQADREYAKVANETKKSSRAAKKQAKAKEKEIEAKRSGRAASKGKDGKAAKPSIWLRFMEYCKAVKSEMQRVVWPTRNELINASAIVIGALIFFGVYIAIIDNVIVIPLNWIASIGS